MDPHTRARVRALRSVEIGLADPPAALRFFAEVWKLGDLGARGGVHYLRGSGGFHHILALHRKPAASVVRMVFDAFDHSMVDALYAQALAFGPRQIETPASLRQPHGTYGFGCKDPEGRNLAVVCGVDDHADDADAPDRPRKISHINLNTGDSEATFAFYRDALGFRLTDTTQRLRFLSCSRDHHSVVLGFTGGPTLNHIAFEAPDLESVMRGAGRMRLDGHPIEWGPGRHGPGNNVFCYFLGPEDLTIELTAEMQQIDASHRPKTPKQWTWPPGQLDYWGISAAPSERIANAGLNVKFTDDGWRLDDWR